MYSYVFGQFFQWLSQFNIDLLPLPSDAHPQQLDSGIFHTITLSGLLVQFAEMTSTKVFPSLRSKFHNIGSYSFFGRGTRGEGGD